MMCGKLPRTDEQIEKRGRLPGAPAPGQDLSQAQPSLSRSCLLAYAGCPSATPAGYTFRNSVQFANDVGFGAGFGRDVVLDGFGLGFGLGFAAAVVGRVDGATRRCCCCRVVSTAEGDGEPDVAAGAAEGDVAAG